MNEKLLMEVSVEKETNTLIVTREFNAGLALVWDAFTNAEILDQWVAPKPLRCKTLAMEFIVGGRRWFVMSNPQGQPQGYSLQYFTTIIPESKLVYISNFADAAGNPNPQYKGSENVVTFSESNGITKVVTTKVHESPQVLDFMVTSGYIECLAESFETLDEIFAAAIKPISK